MKYRPANIGMRSEGAKGKLAIVAVIAAGLVGAFFTIPPEEPPIAADASMPDASMPQVFNTIQDSTDSVFDDIVVLKTSDCFSPHNIDDHGFDHEHLARRVDVKVATPATGDDIALPRLLLDIERLHYTDGARVNHENPIDMLAAIAGVKDVRPDHEVGADGGISVSWARLLARDQDTGEYRHHDEWIADAEAWRSCVEASDFWVVPMYRDGRSQAEWEERVTVFASLFRESFPDESGGSLGVYIWHRERLGPDRAQEWITLGDYVAAGVCAVSLGLDVYAFGHEPEPAEYERAQEYFEAMRSAVTGVTETTER